MRKGIEIQKDQILNLGLPNKQVVEMIEKEYELVEVKRTLITNDADLIEECHALF